jgi:anti-sigma regulatory factor (Ser/Thr protein kinase)
MGKARFELEVAGKLDNLPVISDFISNNMHNFAADPAMIPRVQLAVDEAATNIIKHAYGEKEGSLRLIMELAGPELIITLINWGKPFDPAAISPPDLIAGLEERRIGGLGMYFIRKMMDEVSYSFGPTGNRLTLKKNLH